MKDMTKNLQQGGSMFAICLQSLATATSKRVDPDIKHLLEKFKDLFQEPTQLPPTREIDHHIILKEGTEPINMRP